MKKNCLDPDRQQVFAEYMATLQQSDLTFDVRGRYADTVFLFLMDADSVSRRGYKAYMKANAELSVDKPWTKNALCHFLASRGMGYNGRQVTGKLEKPDGKAMEKREVRQRQVINDFVLWLQNEFDFSAHTMKTYTDTARQFFAYCDEFSQDNARRFIATLEANGLKPQTICLRITGLEKLADFLRKPIKLKRPKMQKTLSVENIPTEDEYNKLLAYCDEHAPKWAYIIRLLGTTGCRVSELIQFTYEQIQAGSCDLKGKGSKYRRFFFTKQVQEGAKGKSGYVCMNRYGSQISTRGIAQELKNLGTKCGIAKEKMHPHAFRHFFAKMYLKKTKDVVSLADILGHGSVDITRIYLQKSYDEQKREINRVVNW
jgi:site-specific recombinase XerD